MSTLTSLIETANNKGYKENFMVQDDGLYAPTTEIHYLPNEVTIDNFYRFEGASNPDDNAILYFIETHDGIKGTLVDSYGAGADMLITEFIKEVEEIHKKEAESKK
ncbi:MAG: hypothetical protein JST82_08150 [Bacteroidetes bacterium]|nr:hypothetical protein [Bacteroidota bacterium]